jgi:hypothetical protein
MKTKTVTESGMEFGPYPEDDFFNIETSETYKKVGENIKIAEFLLIRDRIKSKVWIVEAKSSSPQPQNKQNFDEFIEEIRGKLNNALNLGIATCLQRHVTYTELPSSFKTLDLKKAEFYLILVINGHQEKWLPPLQEALNKALIPTVKKWNLPPTSVIVLNDNMARSRKLIV